MMRARRHLPEPPRPRAAAGYTLIEMLLVIGIIIMMISMVLISV